jgi:TonB family protein
VEIFQVRLLFTLAALVISTTGWSASLGPCSNDDAAALLARIRQYILPAPDSPQHRWMVSKEGGFWRITEYSAHRVFIRCRPMSKADELNGVQYGEIEFRYDASRTTALPKLTSAGLQWKEWSQWSDPSFFPDPAISFRKYKGKFLLEWDYDENANPTLMPAADVKRFFSTADVEAAKLRVAEAEQAKRAEEQERRAQEQEKRAHEDAETARATHRIVGEPARMTRAVNPDDYYPPGSVRREEQGSPVVLACVGVTGKLLREPVVTDTSGFPDLDAAAIEVAKAVRYAPGLKDGTALPESCVKFKVKFSLKNS